MTRQREIASVIGLYKTASSVLLPVSICLSVSTLSFLFHNSDLLVGFIGKEQKEKLKSSFYKSLRNELCQLQSGPCEHSFPSELSREDTRIDGRLNGQILNQNVTDTDSE